MEHMLREIFEKNAQYRVKIWWDTNAYAATLYEEDEMVLRITNRSMFDAVSGLHTYVMIS